MHESWTIVLDDGPVSRQYGLYGEDERREARWAMRKNHTNPGLKIATAYTDRISFDLISFDMVMRRQGCIWEADGRTSFYLHCMEVKASSRTGWC
jgi:hypothetical protein